MDPLKRAPFSALAALLLPRRKHAGHLSPATCATTRNFSPSEAGRRALLALGFVLEDAQHDRCADQRQKPDELALRDLLRPIEDLRAPNLQRGAGLEGQNTDDEQGSNPVRAVQSRMKLSRRSRSRKGPDYSLQEANTLAPSAGEPPPMKRTIRFSPAAQALTSSAEPAPWSVST